ncbi:hypothetical protein BDR04DRAFT_26599 [Suillus decipiens]|nr:hypothetical protein BDR04DRAFT_26599 [Suillus decipiens]
MQTVSHFASGSHADTFLLPFFITSLPSSTHMLLVPIPYNNFVISVNLQFLSLVKVTLLSIRRF